MDLKAMAALPNLQAGTYGDNPFFKLWVYALEQMFPGAAPYIEAAANLLPWGKLAEAVGLAVKEWSAGADFFTILKDTLAVFGAVLPDPVPVPTVP